MINIFNLFTKEKKLTVANEVPKLIRSKYFNKEFEKINKDLAILFSFCDLTDLGDELPWSIMTEEDSQHYFMFVWHTHRESGLGLYPLISCRPRDEFFCFYKGDIILFTFDIMIGAYPYYVENFNLKNYIKNQYDNATLDYVWRSYIRPEIVNWDNEYKDQKYNNVKSWAAQNPYGSFEIPTIVDFGKCWSNKDIIEYLNPFVTIIYDEIENRKINQRFSKFGNQLSVIFKTKKGELVCTYDGLLVHFIPLDGEYIYFFFNTPQEVWEKLIKPDIEEYLQN